MLQKCPMKADNYSIGPAIVNRYRKDWEADMKFWILPYFMEADNWKVQHDLYFKEDPKDLLEA